MPFTFAHLCLTIPARRVGIVASAFAIGAIAPDFQYLLFLSDEFRLLHQPMGVLFLTIPAALIAFWIFQEILKAPLIGLAPASIGGKLTSKLPKYEYNGVKTVSVVLGSILLGVLSHVLWDSFTHDGGWAVERLQVLRHPIYLPLAGARPLHKILQLLSSLLGTLWLVTWCVLWFLRTNVGDPTSSEFLESKAKSLRYPVFGLAVLAGLVSAVAKHAEFNDVSGLPWLLGRSLMTSSAVFLLVVLIIGLIWRTKGITQKGQELASVHRLSR